MPKIALLSNREDSAISHVLRPIAKALQADIFYYPFDDRFISKTYDVVHIGYVGLVRPDLLSTFNATSLNIWNITVNKVHTWSYEVHNYDALVVDDVATYQTIGQLGAPNINYIPLAFEPTGMVPLEPPDCEFTVGSFGNGYDSKRYDAVYAACKLADVRCFMQVLPESRTHYSVHPVRDVYRHIHAYAHASYADTNTMPGYEALLCGRPLITTHNTGVHRFVKHGVNGYFSKGNPADIAKWIIATRDNYERLRNGAITETPQPPLMEAILGYQSMFSELLGGEELPIMWDAVGLSGVAV